MRNPRTLRRGFGLAGIALALLLTGCMTGRPDVNLQSTERNPGTVGTVDLSADKNGNTVAEVKMEHLPMPSTLSPELSTYVVWARPAGADQFVNMGQVAIDPGDRDGRTFLRVPYTSFELLVTAESAPTVQEPSEYRILRGNIGGVPTRNEPARPAAQPAPAQPPPPAEAPQP